ncbi:hypothetical protein GCM10011529_05040 [Polymorphobacter glacialis]|uniref:Uncharacterized protein n=1 Tax=Sandarakinorhabdus glacialis TaxID=1614636 RepID=A0A916ZK03_9SPHN|nr:hypothetical protein [Polymorphobacter glacialis]GGE01674.1 hypothetical protein GCM10011529_05040 [Polymorphobacter glacialis]
MLTKADDFPVHQTPEPIAFAGTDRNFYDRYFFNGYSPDGSVFFAAAMGFYPQLGIIDGAFSLVVDGVQHNVRASRHSVGGERLDLSVGPMRVEIIAPLQQLRVTLEDNDSGISAVLTFDARHAPIEEPRFTRRNGTRLFMDYTRMTQNGGWSGTIRRAGGTITMPPGSMGTRDRSWGIRPVGAPEPQPPPAGNFSQFFWLWTPCNFPGHAVFAHTNDDAAGLPWNRRAVVAKLAKDSKAAETVDIDHVELALSYAPGGRRVTEARIGLGDRGEFIVRPSGGRFYMHGLGYTHPEWSHGMDHGPLAVAHDSIDLAAMDDNAPGNMHLQALSDAVLRWDGEEHHGRGILEQLLLGPHAPSGFSGLLDPAG